MDAVAVVVAAVVAAAAGRYISPVDIPRAAERLYAIPPTRFTAEREALARTLADRGDPAAAAVRKLRRPFGLAWVLNRLAQERPREMAALVAAGDRLRSGQRRAVSGAGAGEMRAAEEDLRARARALRSEGERMFAAEKRSVPPSTFARLELLLRVAAPVPGATRDALRRGVLLREPEIAPGELTGFSVLPGGHAATAPRSDRRAPRLRQAARAASRDDARGRGGEREARERRAAERKVRESEARERREWERNVAAARRSAHAARARAEREERAAAGAAERARRAAERAAAARAEADRLAVRLREVERGT